MSLEITRRKQLRHRGFPAVLLKVAILIGIDLSLKETSRCTRFGDSPIGRSLLS